MHRFWDFRKWILTASGVDDDAVIKTMLNDEVGSEMLYARILWGQSYTAPIIKTIYWFEKRVIGSHVAYIVIIGTIEHFDSFINFSDFSNNLVAKFDEWGRSQTKRNTF